MIAHGYLTVCVSIISAQQKGPWQVERVDSGSPCVREKSELKWRHHPTHRRWCNTQCTVKSPPKINHISGNTVVAYLYTSDLTGYLKPFRDVFFWVSLNSHRHVMLCLVNSATSSPWQQLVPPTVMASLISAMVVQVVNMFEMCPLITPLNNTTTFFTALRHSICFCATMYSTVSKCASMLVGGES